MSNIIGLSSTLKKQQLNLINVTPQTETQHQLFNSYKKHQNHVLMGPPGTGKTFLALFLALKDLLEKNGFNQVVIFRSAAQTRNIGFMPGDEKEKTDPFKAPYIGILSFLFKRNDAFTILENSQAINLSLTSFVRGSTLDNTILIIDEFQNMTSHEAESVLTRAGEFSKVIVTGDFDQSDLGKNDISDFINVLRNMNSFSFTGFKVEDIVRSGLVKEFIEAKINLKIKK